VSVQHNGLIADDAAAPVHFGRVNEPGVHIAFGTGHKEGARLMHLEQASKVQVPPGEAPAASAIHPGGYFFKWRAVQPGTWSMRHCHHLGTGLMARCT